MKQRPLVHLDNILLIRDKMHNLNRELLPIYPETQEHYKIL